MLDPVTLEWILDSIFSSIVAAMCIEAALNKCEVNQQSFPAVCIELLHLVPGLLSTSNCREAYQAALESDGIWQPAH